MRLLIGATLVSLTCLFGSAEPQQRWIGQAAADVTNADLRDSMIGLHTALTELKEKIDAHDRRDKTTSQSMLNSMRRLGSVSTNMETVANNLGRMDVRLAKLERQIAEQDEKQKAQLPKIGQAIESLVSLVNSKLGGSSAVQASSSRRAEDLNDKLNSIESKLDTIRQEIARSALGSSGRASDEDSKVAQALKETKDDIAFIKDEVVIINDALKTSAVAVTSAGGNLGQGDGSKLSKQIASLESKLESVDSGLQSQGQRISQLYDDSTSLMETQLSKLMDLEKTSLKHGGVLASLTATTEALASVLGNHNETVQELNKLRYGIENTGEMSNRIITLISETKDSLMTETEQVERTFQTSNSLVEALHNNLTGGYKELSEEIRGLGKMGEVLLSTADLVLSIKRSVEFGVQQVNFEMGSLIRSRSDDIKSSVLEEVGSARDEVIEKVSKLVINSTVGIQEEVSQVWRQIGILYSQMTSSQAVLESVRNQTTTYVNGSLNQVGEMNSRVGQVSNHMAEVQDNLNYLLGRLSLVASEFSLMKNAVGDELQNIRDDFGKMKPGGKDNSAGGDAAAEDKGPGPFPIDNKEVPTVDLNQGPSPYAAEPGEHGYFSRSHNGEMRQGKLSFNKRRGRL